MGTSDAPGKSVKRNQFVIDAHLVTGRATLLSVVLMELHILLDVMLCSVLANFLS